MNSREIAVVAWAAAALIAVVASSAARPHLGPVVRAFLKPKLSGIFAGLALWTTGLLFAAGHLGLWTPGQIGDVIFWYVGTGAVLLFRAIEREKQRGFFTRTAGEAAGAGVLLEGVVNIGVLPLPAELVLLPVTTLLAVAAVVAAHDEKLAGSARAAGGRAGTARSRAADLWTHAVCAC